MKKDIRVLIGLAGLLAAWPCYGSGKAGTTGAPFLRMGAGVRAEAMGSAFSALADDATALYWNPAGLGQIEHRSATLMHAAQIDNSYYDFAGYGQKLGQGGIGLAVQYYSAGAVDNTDKNGNNTGSFTPNDMALTLGYARTLGGFQVGLSGKYIQSKLVNSASTLALDAGILTPRYFKDRVWFGLAATNVGGGLKYDQETTDLPQTLRGGAGVKVIKDLTLGVDVVAPKNEDLYFSGGLDYRLEIAKTMALSLRGGYNGQKSGQGTGLTAGMGFEFGVFAVDYAYVTQGDFSAGNRFSLSAKF